MALTKVAGDGPCCRCALALLSHVIDFYMLLVHTKCLSKLHYEHQHHPSQGNTTSYKWRGQVPSSQRFLPVRSCPMRDTGEVCGAPGEHPSTGLPPSSPMWMLSDTGEAFSCPSDPDGPTKSTKEQPALAEKQCRSTGARAVWPAMETRRERGHPCPILHRGSGFSQGWWNTGAAAMGPSGHTGPPDWRCRGGERGVPHHRCHHHHHGHSPCGNSGTGSMDTDTCPVTGAFLGPTASTQPWLTQ